MCAFVCCRSVTVGEFHCVPLSLSLSQRASTVWIRSTAAPTSAKRRPKGVWPASVVQGSSWPGTREAASVRAQRHEPDFAPHTHSVTRTQLASKCCTNSMSYGCVSLTPQWLVTMATEAASTPVRTQRTAPYAGVTSGTPCNLTRGRV